MKRFSVLIDFVVDAVDEETAKNAAFMFANSEYVNPEKAGLVDVKPYEGVSAVYENEEAEAQDD